VANKQPNITNLLNKTKSENTDISNCQGVVYHVPQAKKVMQVILAANSLNGVEIINMP